MLELLRQFLVHQDCLVYKQSTMIAELDKSICQFDGDIAACQDILVRTMFDTQALKMHKNGCCHAPLAE
jgi:hypothetical protein